MDVRNDAAACRQPVIATGADGLKCAGNDVADVGSVPELTLSRTPGQMGRTHWSPPSGGWDGQPPM